MESHCIPGSIPHSMLYSIKENKVKNERKDSGYCEEESHEIEHYMNTHNLCRNRVDTSAELPDIINTTTVKSSVDDILDVLRPATRVVTVGDITPVDDKQKLIVSKLNRGFVSLTQAKMVHKRNALSLSERFAGFDIQPDCDNFADCLQLETDFYAQDIKRPSKKKTLSELAKLRHSIFDAYHYNIEKTHQGQRSHTGSSKQDVGSCFPVGIRDHGSSDLAVEKDHITSAQTSQSKQISQHKDELKHEKSAFLKFKWDWIKEEDVKKSNTFTQINLDTIIDKHERHRIERLSEMERIKEENSHLFQGLYKTDPKGKFQGRTLLKGVGVQPRRIPLEPLYKLHPIKPSGKPETIPVDPRPGFYGKIHYAEEKKTMDIKLQSLSGISEIQHQIEGGINEESDNSNISNAKDTRGDKRANIVDSMSKNDKCKETTHKSSEKFDINGNISANTSEKCVDMSDSSGKSTEKTQENKGNTDKKEKDQSKETGHFEDLAEFFSSLKRRAESENQQKKKIKMYQDNEKYTRKLNICSQYSSVRSTYSPYDYCQPPVSDRETIYYGDLYPSKNKKNTDFDIEPGEIVDNCQKHASGKKKKYHHYNYKQKRKF